MSRDEQIKNYAINNCIQDDIDDTSYELIIETAKWADETMLDKVCEWLKEQNKTCMFELEMILGDKFIEEFRKEMEM